MKLGSGWKLTRQEVAPDGHLVQLFVFESGKGRAKFRNWRLLRNGAYAGYASVERDVEANFGRVMDGAMLNPSTGRYEPGGVIWADRCPICFVDLKGEGYPIGHKTDEGDECEFVFDPPVAPDEDTPAWGAGARPGFASGGHRRPRGAVQEARGGRQGGGDGSTHMFKLVTYGEQQVEQIFKNKDQGAESCDVCGDDLEIHAKLVVVFDLDGDAPGARHWLDPRDDSEIRSNEIMLVNSYRVVGCDRKARTWRLWATHAANPTPGREFLRFGSEETVRRTYGFAGPPVEVDLTEDPDGPYYGWVDCRPRDGYTGMPTMIQPHPAMFRLQEPSGFEQPLRQGRGEVVQMTVRAL